jgi:hypothetical protein
MTGEEEGGCGWFGWGGRDIGERRLDSRGIV